MTTPSKDDVLRVAQECGAMTGTGSIQFRLDGSLERFAAAMYAAGQESAKADGWRQCAVGQHTSQFCGQAEAVVAAEREIDEELALAESLIAKISGSALLAGEKCHKDDSALLYKIACDALVTVAYARSLLSALPITQTNTEGEQG